ncbi:MAG TPA: polyprenol monophosphomannose synthase [Bacteroidetes bacterium]|nr:polyprenol monophosphomannose synthase [Bacteroidota bacterium]
MKRILAIIPTFNERDNVLRVIERVLAQDPRISVLVVDDNSPDGTAELVEEVAAAEARITLLRRAAKLGLGTAYVAGFKHALEEGYDAVIEIDADMSHNPDDLPRLIQCAEDSHFVIGSRYVSGVNVINWPLQRLLLSYFASVYSRWVTGMPFRDLTAGFALIRREVLEAVDLDSIHSNGYAFQIEIKYLAWIRGFRLAECPIVFTERAEGSSKMNRRIVYEAIWMVWKLRFSHLFRGRR